MAVNAPTRRCPQSPVPIGMPPMPLSEPEKTGLYPRELETLETLRDGTVRVGLRPLHPDDKAALYDLAAHMTAEDVRLRFFTPLHGLPDALVARLLRLDEDRCMALAALHDGAVLGIARYTAGSGSPVGRIRGRRAQRLERPRDRLSADDPADRNRPTPRDRRARRRGFARKPPDVGDVPRIRLFRCTPTRQIRLWSWCEKPA